MCHCAQNLVKELANCNELGQHLIEKISLLCSDCLIALISMLSHLLFSTFAECIASATLLLLITASIGIDCGDNNKTFSISDRKKIACSFASCKLRASDAMVERTICLIFFAC